MKTKKLEANTPVVIKKYWNKIIWTNLAFSYSIIFLVFSICFGYDAFGGDIAKFSCNVTVGAIMLVASLVWISVLGILMRKNYQGYFSPESISHFTVFAFIPVLGAILSFACKRIERKNTSIKVKKFQPSTYTLLIFLVLFVVLIIWLVYLTKGPITYIDKDGVSQTGLIPGLFDVLLSPINGFIDAGDLIVFLLVIGGFLQLVTSSKALDVGVGALIRKMKGKEIFLIPALMTLFAIGGTTFGMCEETLPFYLILTPIMLSAGFDTLTSVFTILFGAGLGVAGAILDPFLIPPAVTASISGGVNPSTLTTSTGIVWRIITFALLLITTTAAVTAYAYKVKKSPESSIIYDLKQDHMKHFKMSDKGDQPLTHKQIAILSIFGATFLIMIIMVIDWKDMTGFTGFEWLHTWLINHLPFFSSNLSAIGSWYLPEMSFLFLISGLIIGIISWKSEEQFFADFFTGAKDFLGVAVIIAIARGLSLILVSSGINYSLVNGLSSMINSMNAQLGIIVIFCIFTILSFLIPSTSGFASAVFPIMGPSIANSTTGLTVSGGITTFALSNGWVNVFSPTSGPFVAGCALARVPLEKFYKGSWKILLLMLAVILFSILIGTLVPKLF